MYNLFIYFYWIKPVPELHYGQVPVVSLCILSFTSCFSLCRSLFPVIVPSSVISWLCAPMSRWSLLPHVLKVTSPFPLRQIVLFHQVVSVAGNFSCVISFWISNLSLAIYLCPFCIKDLEFWISRSAFGVLHVSPWSWHLPQFFNSLHVHLARCVSVLM